MVGRVGVSASWRGRNKGGEEAAVFSSKGPRGARKGELPGEGLGVIVYKCAKNADSTEVHSFGRGSKGSSGVVKKLISEEKDGKKKSSAASSSEIKWTRVRDRVSDLLSEGHFGRGWG